VLLEAVEKGRKLITERDSMDSMMLDVMWSVL
jgi:hypothetical protein